MNENKTSTPLEQIFKIAIVALNLALMLMVFDTKEEVRALQKETARLEEGVKLLLETKKQELEEKVLELKKQGNLKKRKSENSI